MKALLTETDTIQGYIITCDESGEIINYIITVTVGGRYIEFTTTNIKHYNDAIRKSKVAEGLNELKGYLSLRYGNCKSRIV